MQVIVDARSIYLFIYFACRFLFQSPIVHLVGLSFMACLDSWLLQIYLFNAEIHSQHVLIYLLTSKFQLRSLFWKTAGQIAQSVKHSLCRYEDESDPQNSHEKAKAGSSLVLSRTGEVETGRFLGLVGQASLLD